MKLVFDLDGTIIFKGEPLSEGIASAIAELQHKGFDVIFASARPVRDMIPVLDEQFHNGTLIGGNGSMVYREGKLVSETSFQPESMNALQELIETYQATYLIDSEWDYAYTGPDDHPILNNLDPYQLASHVPVGELPTIVKVLILTASHMEELTERVENLDVVIHRHHKEDLIDINPKGIHKWSALQQIGVKEGEYIAFGNDANDITMFEHAAHAIQIGDLDSLTPFSDETIALGEDQEEHIINKLRNLEHMTV